MEARVTDTSGKVLRGSLLNATDTDLLVDVRGEIRRYWAFDVAEFRARVFDTLWEGALIGTVVGAGFGGRWRDKLTAGVRAGNRLGLVSPG